MGFFMFGRNRLEHDRVSFLIHQGASEPFARWQTPSAANVGNHDLPLHCEPDGNLRLVLQVFISYNLHRISV